MKITKNNLPQAIAALRRCAKENKGKQTDTGCIVVSDLCLDVADYLEKPADKVNPKFKVGDTIRLKNSNAEYIIESISDSHYYGKGFSISIVGGNRDYELVEQKPADWLQEVEDKLANATPKQLAEWKEKYFKEEPAEWSEEDEENLKWFEKFFRAESVIAEGKDIPQDRYLWFKNLKGRVQPKQEWNEEDRKMMRNIIDDIHCGTNFNPEVMHAANERVKWFKSICMRYQSKWKPSEEQMEALEHFIVCHNGSTNYAKDLEELRLQLKKL